VKKTTASRQTSMFWSSCCLTSAGIVSLAHGSSLTSLYLVMSTSKVPAIFAVVAETRCRAESSAGGGFVASNTHHGAVNDTLLLRSRSRAAFRERRTAGGALKVAA